MPPPVSSDLRDRLAQIQTFPQLVVFLRDEMGWPIERESFEDLTFEYTPEELGIDSQNAAKIQEIRRLRPVATNQPWGVFFVKFEPKRLPVVALRRILSSVALKKRRSANSAERAAWSANDLLFVSSYGEKDDRNITFAHFSADEAKNDLPTLKVLGWDDQDTALHLEDVAEKLRTKLAWPADPTDLEGWRRSWRSAFTLRHGEVITTSKMLAVRLAALARAIRERALRILGVESDDGPLRRLQKAFREALIHDLDGKGFADMYAQTIAYGLLSARIANPKANTAESFAGQLPVTNPFLKELMETFLHVGGRRGTASKRSGLDFDELGVSEVVELLDNSNMEAVVGDFGDRNPQEDPVIHFYELFLKEYDAKKRMQRGVFYTPRPVVSYIVRSVDKLLRTEFGLADGLADTTTWGEMAKLHDGLTIPEGVSPDQDFVQVLDPATGTGTFLVEVIDLIHKTLVTRWRTLGHGEQDITTLWNDYVPKHLLTRLHGYELLMAPYAIAHLKIGLKLYETGYRFGSAERARIYLTNALEPPHDFSGRFDFAIPALAHESQSVNSIKQGKRFSVVIGNPPYSEKSKNEGAWIASLMERYKSTIRSEEAQIKAVSNDYVKFLCFVHHTADLAGSSIIGVITSNGYFDGRLFRDLRRSWLASFQRTDLLNLHGSGRRGDAELEDENVFDILQGVGIVIARRLHSSQAQGVHYREMLGPRSNKYRALLEQCAGEGIVLSVREPLFLFVPSAEVQIHVATFSLAAIFGTGNAKKDRNKTYAGGFKTRQDGFTVAFDERTLRDRISELADSSNEETMLREKYGLCSTAHFEFKKARIAAQSGGLTQSIRLARYRPFDDRPMIWSREVLCEPQGEVTRHLVRPNLCLGTSRVVKDDAFRHVTVANGPMEVISLSSSTSTNAYMFPLFRYNSSELFEGSRSELTREVNLSRQFRSRMVEATGLRWDETNGATSKRSDSLTPEGVFFYLYALLHAPLYRNVFADELLRDFPPIPLPSSQGLFLALARAGSELTALHLLTSPTLEQASAEYFGGHTQTVERVSWNNETVWLDKAQTAGFRGVPKEVWSFFVGGYQVCEKWLKDRKGRRLSKGDIAHYQKIVVALSETIRLMKEIDEVLERHGGWPGAFQSGDATAAPGEVLPFRPRAIEPKPEDRYVTCVPLVPLKAAAGVFGEPQYFEQDAFDWVAVESRHRLRQGVFVAQVVGTSMEPSIPDGAYCLFRAPVEGTRQGKAVLVRLRDAVDPETGERYTVKRYESRKSGRDEVWRHEAITLKPENSEFSPIELEAGDDERLEVVAEFLEVLTGPSGDGASATTSAGAEEPPAELAKAAAGSKQPTQRSLLEQSAEQLDLGESADEPEPRDEARPRAGELDRDELICGLRALFGDGVTRSRDEAIRDLARELGFERTGPRIREEIDNAIRTAVRRGVLKNSGSELTLNARNIEQYDRSFLKEQFLAALGGTTWVERDEATKRLARWMGFRRTGSQIGQVVKSLVNGLLREGRIESEGDSIRRATE